MGEKVPETRDGYNISKLTVRRTCMNTSQQVVVFESTKVYWFLLLLSLLFVAFGVYDLTHPGTSHISQKNLYVFTAIFSTLSLGLLYKYALGPISPKD